MHSATVSGAFWESIGGKISSPMDYKVGTVDGHSEGLQVLGVGEPWQIYLKGMEEHYIIEPLVIQGLSHSVTSDIFLEGVQPEVDLHGGGSHTKASKRQVSLRSLVGGWGMS